jgi:hypothetical protein
MSFTIRPRRRFPVQFVVYDRYRPTLTDQEG